MARNVELVYIATGLRVHATRACLNFPPVMDVRSLSQGEDTLTRYFGVFSGLNLADDVASCMGHGIVEIVKEVVLVT